MHISFYQITVIGFFALLASGCVTKQVDDSPIVSNIPSMPISATNNHQTNQACIDVIKEFEGVRLNAYKGPGGHWLIGYGHKAGVFKGMSISQAEAENMLKQDLQLVENNVNRLVKVNINENQFSALVCLAYNIGWGNFASSTLLRKLNSGDFDEAANQFAVWRKVNGNVNSHQVKRRAVERDIFIR